MEAGDIGLQTTISATVIGWIVGGLGVALATIFRFILGRHYQATDAMNEKLEALDDRIGAIEGDVAYIRGKFDGENRHDSRHNRRP